MSKLERFVARWLILRLLRWPQQPRLQAFFRLLREMTNSEFPEDNMATSQAFLVDQLHSSFKEAA